MSELIQFGKLIQITHKYLEFETAWVTDIKPSYFDGHDWQYLVKTDKRLNSGSFIWGGVWYDEMDLQSIDGEDLPENLYTILDVNKPEEWPPNMTQTIERRPGIWGINGSGVNRNLITKMLSWNPGSITCFYDYLQANGVNQYRDKYSNAPIIIRFQHDKNWWENPSENAKNKSDEIVSKWSDIQHLNPYIYFCNEMNLHYENGDNDIGNQYKYETPEFYKKYADWVTELADRIKQQAPDMRLVCPPFAFGHKEDGEPENGIPKLGWSGYQYLTETIKTHFNNIICGHYYWGNAGGSNKDWLYGDDSQWHAFRWRKVLELFKVSYGMDVKMIIDEAGNFATIDNDFTDQVIHYSNEVFKCDDIIALTFFLFNDPTNSPGNTPNDWQRIEDLDSHLAKMKEWKLDNTEIPPEPPIEPPPVEPETKYEIKVTYQQSGLPLIVGSYPANVPIIVQPPYGNSYTVIAGSKPEYGTGGFEAGYANMQGIYILTIEGDKYEVYSKADGSLIQVEFVDNGEVELVVIQSKEITETKANEIMNNYPDIFEVIE